jgi:hypothetical protein
MVGLGVSSPLHISVPLQLVPNESGYSVSIALDGMQSGSCGWRLVGLAYSVDGEGRDPEYPGPIREALINMGSSQSVDYDLNIWCVKVPELSAGVSEYCGALGILNEHFSDRVPNRLLNSIPTDEQGLNTPQEVGPRAKTITVRFHDLDNDAALSAP